MCQTVCVFFNKYIRMYASVCVLQQRLCVCVCACVYSSTNVSDCVWVCARASTNVSDCECVHVYSSTNSLCVFMYICASTNVSDCVCRCVCFSKCLRLCVRVSQQMCQILCVCFNKCVRLCACSFTNVSDSVCVCMCVLQQMLDSVFVCVCVCASTNVSDHAHTCVCMCECVFAYFIKCVRHGFSWWQEYFLISSDKPFKFQDMKGIFQSVHHFLQFPWASLELNFSKWSLTTVDAKIWNEYINIKELFKYMRRELSLRNMIYTSCTKANWQFFIVFFQFMNKLLNCTLYMQSGQA